MILGFSIFSVVKANGIKATVRKLMTPLLSNRRPVAAIIALLAAFAVYTTFVSTNRTSIIGYRSDFASSVNAVPARSYGGSDDDYDDGGGGKNETASTATARKASTTGAPGEVAASTDATAAITPLFLFHVGKAGGGEYTDNDVVVVVRLSRFPPPMPCILSLFFLF